MQCIINNGKTSHLFQSAITFAFIYCLDKNKDVPKMYTVSKKIVIAYNPEETQNDSSLREHALFIRIHWLKYA